MAETLYWTQAFTLKQYNFPVDESIFAAFFGGGVDDEPPVVAVGLRIDTLIVYDYKSKTGGAGRREYYEYGLKNKT